LDKINFNGDHENENENNSNEINIVKEKLKKKYNSKILKEYMNYQNQLTGYNEKNKSIDKSCISFNC
jgi:hypothetical protein